MRKQVKWTEEDEKGSGGFWDKAGEIAEQYELHRVERDENEPVYADERLQEMIYNALTSSYGQGVMDERERILEKLKYDLFPVQAKMENPGYWDGYTDTIFKIKDIIQALKNNNH